MKKLIDHLIDLCITKTKWVNLFSLSISILGLIALLNTKRDLHPAFQINYVSVKASFPQGSALEIEKSIASPLEDKLRDLPDLEEMTSSIKAGIVSINLKYPASVKNINERLETIRSRVALVSQYFPQGVRDIEVTQFKNDSIFLANIGLSGIDEKNWQHHSFLQNLTDRLSRVKGIFSAQSTLQPYHVFIRFDKKKLEQSGLSINQLRELIRSEIETQSISYQSINGQDWLIEFSREPFSLDKIKNISLSANSQGYGLKLKDVALVEFDLAQSENYKFLLNGKKAIELTIMKAEKADSLETFELLKKELSLIQFPQGVEYNILYDGPYFIKQQIDVLVSNGFGGLALVLIMLGLAMGWKTSLMTALGLPISYFGTFIILKLMGISIDLLSMIAMILVVGNLVDDAVIFAERYNQLLSEGLDPQAAASSAAKELIVPVTGTIATIICAFLPIVLIESELSVIFFAIPVVITSALALSWLETFFVLPNHLQHYVKKPSSEKSQPFFNWLGQVYKKILNHTLKLRYLYAVLALVLLGFSLFTASKMPQNFQLSINAPQVEIFVVFKEDHSYSKVQELLSSFHFELSQISKSQLDFIETNLGLVWSEGKMYRGPKFAMIRLVLNKAEVDTKSLRENVFLQAENIVKKIKLPEIEKIEVLKTERGSSERKLNVTSLEISGRDEDQFLAAEKDLIERVSKSSLIDSYLPPDNLGPETYQFKLNPEAQAKYNLSKNQLAFALQGEIGSLEILQTRNSGRWLNIYLESANKKTPNLESLNEIKIQSQKSEETFPVNKLGSWIKAFQTKNITHKNATRILTLDFRYKSELTNEQIVQKELKKLIEPLQSKYNSLELKVVDSNEQDKKGRDWTGQIILTAALLIYIILALTLKSWTQPFIVGLPIPFAFIGVIWALKLHDLPLGLMSMIGVIGTMGVAVNDSIVMVHYINLLKEKYGYLNQNLIINGASSRLRAIFLTATCTLIGVFPTAYGLGGESGFTQPLAFSLGWGLTTSLALTLFIIPAMMMILEDLKELLTKATQLLRKSS